jgi:hypothetical protein
MIVYVSWILWNFAAFVFKRRRRKKNARKRRRIKAIARPVFFANFACILLRILRLQVTVVTPHTFINALQVHVRPTAQTVFRINYRRQWQKDLLGNSPSNTAGIQIGISSYF